MGASISFDSKYRLILDTEVECISVNPPTPSKSASSSGATASGSGRKNKKNERVSESESEQSDDDHDSESGSEHESGSGSDSDTDNKTYTVKITPEIVSYIRNYLRKNEFLDEFDLITEIDLDKYDHAPGSALVFNSDSVVFMTNNQTIEAVGDWEYLPPENEEKPKSKSKSKNKKHRGHDESDSEDEYDVNERKQSKYKTKDDDLPVSEIENILAVKFEEYNKTREFIIHESKNSFLCLKINSVEIVKA